MSSTLEQIQKVIQKAGIDGALTQDAIGLFNKTIEKARALKVELEELKEAHKKLDERWKERGEELEIALTKLKRYDEREDQLEERETKMLHLELTAEYEAERVKDHKEMFGLVFRNLETRQHMYRNGQAPSGDQYGNTVNTNENEDKITKIE